METKENEEPITFTPPEKGDIIVPDDDPLEISTIIVKHPMGRILVDSSNLVNLIYWSCFKQMKISHNQQEKDSSPLYCFTRETILVASLIQLPITLGSKLKSIT